MPSGELPKVRTRKLKTRDPTMNTNQGFQGVVHGQQPPVRKSNRAAPQQQPPAVASLDGYGNADPAQTYPEHYGYGEEQYVDAHRYGYGGAQADAHQGYGYGNANQGYGFGDANQGVGYGDSGQGYGYEDASHGYGYGDASQGHGYNDAAQGYAYGGAQGYGQDYVATSQHTAKQKPKKNRKPKPAVDGAYQGEHQGSSESQFQGNGYGQPVQDKYEGSYGSQHRVDEYGQPVQDRYAYPEAYDAAPEPKAHKSSKSRKPSKDKSLEKGNHGDGGYVDPGNGAHAPQHGEPNYDNGMVPTVAAKSKGRKYNTESQYEDFPVPTEETPYAETALPSRAIARVRGDYDGDTGSPRSRASQDGSARSKSSDREGSGSNRAKPHRDGSRSGRVKAENETRTSREGLTPRLNPVGKDGSGRGNPEQRSARSNESEGKSVKTPEAQATSNPSPSPNPLNEYLRKTAGTGKPAYNDMSMAVFHDPNDRTLVHVKTPKDQPKESPAARPSLDEWMKKQSKLSGGNNFNQHESLIVMPDDNKELLETQLFGAPLATKHSMKLPPVGETVDRSQYQPRGDTNQYQPVAKEPLYQPVQRRPYAKTPLQPSTEPRAGAGAEQGAVEVYDAQGKQVQPNAKCMACVHGIGVPVARIATRIACRQCLTWCTIL